MSPDDPIICVIDDDPAVLRGLTRLLGAHGYQVRTFLSAREFLDGGRDGDAGIQCLVVDVHMAGMSGFDLQAALQSAGRPLPLVLITGASDAKLRTRASGGSLVLLEKPFGEEELIEAIRLARSAAKDLTLTETGTTGP